MDAPHRTQQPRAPFSAVPWPSPDHETARAREHFLIASDDTVLCRDIRAALRQLGCVGTFLRSGIDVVHTTCVRPPRLVLIDQDLHDFAGLDVARALNAADHHQFVLIGKTLTTSLTVEAMKLGAVTVLEKPVAVSDLVVLLRSVLGEPRAAEPSKNRPPAAPRAPRSIAERWARNVVKGCEADGDLKTLGDWASIAGLSYSSLCEICRLAGVQPLAARDLTRVLRALVQSQLHDCRIGELLDICDRRTLNALMRRGAVDPRRRGREISVEQFLRSQRFVPAGNAGLGMVRALLPHDAPASNAATGHTGRNPGPRGQDSGVLLQNRNR